MLKTVLTILALCTIATAIGFWAMDVYLATSTVELSIHGKIAMALGIFFTCLIGFGLMGLLFMSNRRGHDAAVYDYTTTTNSTLQEESRSDG